MTTKFSLKKSMETYILWMVIGALAYCSLSAQENSDAGKQSGVVINFHLTGKIRARNIPWQLTLTNPGITPPAVSTTDPSKSVPGLTGSFGSDDADGGSIVLTLDGRSDELGCGHLVRR